VALADARIADARRHHQEALEIRAALGGEAEAAESRLALALVAIKDGRANDGLTEVAKATQALKMLHVQASECYAWGVAAAVLASAGRAVDAREAAESAERLRPAVQTVSRRLWIGIYLARADASRGLRDRAVASLRKATAEAKQRGFAWLAREGQRAISDILATPTPSPGKR
jgi:predicted DNA-binding transcriptional regulator YafY